MNFNVYMLKCHDGSFALQSAKLSSTPCTGMYFRLLVKLSTVPVSLQHSYCKLPNA